jgi:opacity protein-like surface antigen
VIDVRPIWVSLFGLAIAEPCFAQLQIAPPAVNGQGSLSNVLQPFQPQSPLGNLVPSFKNKNSLTRNLPQRLFPAQAKPEGEKAKRVLKVGPCAFPFMENCVVGPYVSAAFSLSNNSFTGSGSSSSSYSSTHFRLQLDTTSTSSNSWNTASNGLAGFDIALGYDLGGIRTELNYSFSSGTTNTASISGSGTDSYEFTEAGIRFPTFNSNASGTVPSISFNRQSLLANLAVDIPTGRRLIPYFGGGIGVAWLSIGSFNTQTSDLCTDFGVGIDTCPALLNGSGGTASTIAAQAKAGISYMVNLRTNFYIEAVYDYTGSVTIGSITLNSFNQYSGKLGVRYRF